MRPTDSWKPQKLRGGRGSGEKRCEVGNGLWETRLWPFDRLRDDRSKQWLDRYEDGNRRRRCNWRHRGSQQRNDAHDGDEATVAKHGLWLVGG